MDKKNAADQFLEKLGLKFEDLDQPGHMGEKEAYFALLNQSADNPLTIATLRRSILQMRHAVEMELTDAKHDIKDDIFLKARLRNYLLLEAVLYSPADAQDIYEADFKDLLKSRKK